MRYIAILIAVFFSSELIGQTDKLTVESKEFISNQIKIYEPNPIHQDRSRGIDSLFIDKLISFPDIKLDTNVLVRLLLDNSVTSYEDSQEAYRYSIRRCIIFSLFAMSVQPDKANLFLDLAEKSLLNSENGIDQFYMDTYAGLLILDLLIKDSNKTLTMYDAQRTSDKYKVTESSLDKKVYDQGANIIETFKQKIKN